MPDEIIDWVLGIMLGLTAPAALYLLVLRVAAAAGYTWAQRILCTHWNIHEPKPLDPKDHGGDSWIRTCKRCGQTIYMTMDADWSARPEDRIRHD